MVPSGQNIAFQRLPAEESPIPEHDWLLKYWNLQRGERFAPAWQDIDLIIFPATLLPWLVVTDIIDGGEAFQYRYFGSDLVTFYDRDYTRASPADIPPYEFGQYLIGTYHELIRLREPTLDVQECILADHYVGVQAVLRLPISDDGENVTKAIFAPLFSMSRFAADLQPLFQVQAS